MNVSSHGHICWILISVDLKLKELSGMVTLCHEERGKICCNQKVILDLGACLALFPPPASCMREFLCLPWADISSMENICLRASDVWKNKPELALRVVEVMWGGCPLHRLVHLSKWLTAELTAQRTVWNQGCILDAFPDWECWYMQAAREEKTCRRLFTWFAEWS